MQVSQRFCPLLNFFVTDCKHLANSGWPPKISWWAMGWTLWTVLNITLASLCIKESSIKDGHKGDCQNVNNGYKLCQA